MYVVGVGGSYSIGGLLGSLTPPARGPSKTYCQFRKIMKNNVYLMDNNGIIDIMIIIIIIMIAVIITNHPARLPACKPVRQPVGQPAS